MKRVPLNHQKRGRTCVEVQPSVIGCVACVNATPWTVVDATVAAKLAATLVHRNGLAKSAAGWPG
jgi:hypothetical protein